MSSDDPRDESPPGDPVPGIDVLPQVYTELRRLARARMAKLPPGNTLQATALVHEAYLRLAADGDDKWNNRGHFFAAAAQAMRQILVDQARRKAAVKHGGDRQRLDVDDVDLPIEKPVEEILDLDLALTRLQKEDPRKGEIVLLRYFAGLTREEAAAAMGMSLRTLDREWRFIVAWLHKQLAADD